MPAPAAPAKSVPGPKRPAAATTQPLTVDASGEGVEAPAADAEQPPAPSAEDIVAAAKSAPAPAKKEEKKPPFVENQDGSITIDFDFPVDVTRFGIPNVTKLTGLTLQPAAWKRRRAAARRYPQNATALDQDTCLISELTGYPEHVIDEIDGRDMSLVQAALGKLLYSPRMFLEG